MAQQRVERRLAAILAADVAGYSRLMGVDEAGTARALREHREAVEPIVAGNSGRIVKTAGDGMLVEFSSVVAAVECAIAVQKLIAERNAAIADDRHMLFRIGVNLGDVLIEGDDILGDGVNVAARLEGIAEPGGICLSWDAYRHVKGKIVAAFTDMGEHRLKNIAEPVRVYAIAPTAVHSPVATAALPGAAAPPRLSMVVLPFTNLGGDKEQDYFVDGITESLTTDLSRIRGAFVIACNTAFAYRGRALDVRQIGRELGVRYVMEGSVQSSADRIRVNAQLIDAETGAHLWAERFDKPRADLFDMQDEITTRLARMMGIEIVTAESRRLERERPNNMDSVDLTMRGWATWIRTHSVDRTREARGLFEAALRLDDRNTRALVGLAATCLHEVFYFTADSPAEQIRTAETAILKALALEPDSASAHYWHANLLYALRAPERALRECILAISLNCNVAWAHALSGLTKIGLGRAEETEAHVTNAIRLSPRDPGLGSWHFYAGTAALFLGRFDHAIDRLRRAIEINPNIGPAWLRLAAALALLGRVAEASEACATGLRLMPGYNISRFRSESISDNPVYLAQREKVLEGMRKAGVPEE